MGKKLLEYTNSFCRNEFKKKDKTICSYFMHKYDESKHNSRL